MYIIIIGLLSSYLCGYAGEKRALIVAISQYPKHSGWDSISADNDVKLLVNTLKKKDFSEEDIVILQDSSAKKQRIVAEFKSLHKRAKAGDFIYIHFSCHGQQMEDDNGDEPDGLDEAIVCYDAKMRYFAGKYEGENHLRDDELDTLLRPIRKKLGGTGNLIVVLDACHSQSGTRAEDDNKEVFRGTGVIFSQTTGYKGKKGVDNTKAPLFQEKGLSPITELAACKSDERNWEYKTNSESYGSLSYALCFVWDKYKDFNNMFDYRSWFKEVEDIIKGMRKEPPYQTPVFRTTLKDYAGNNK